MRTETLFCFRNNAFTEVLGYSLRANDINLHTVSRFGVTSNEGGQTPIHR